MTTTAALDAAIETGLVDHREACAMQYAVRVFPGVFAAAMDIADRCCRFGINGLNLDTV